MGVPYAEILGNHSKGLPVRFYTLWAGSCLKGLARSGRKLRFACSWLESTVSGSVWRLISAKSKRSKHL